MSSVLPRRLPTDPLRVLVLGATVHVQWRQGYSETLYLDGSKAHADSETKPEKVRLAIQLGYGPTDEAVHMMDWEHDVVHTLLARARGQAVSPGLWALAHGEVAEGDVAAYREEEEDVLALQAYLNTRQESKRIHNLRQELGNMLQLVNLMWSILGRARWVLLPFTSPSGKLLFACEECGRISPTPDKRCSGPGATKNCEESR